MRNGWPTYRSRNQASGLPLGVRAMHGGLARCRGDWDRKKADSHALPA